MLKYLCYSLLLFSLIQCKAVEPLEALDPTRVELTAMDSIVLPPHVLKLFAGNKRVKLKNTTIVVQQGTSNSSSVANKPKAPVAVGEQPTAIHKAEDVVVAGAGSSISQPVAAPKAQHTYLWFVIAGIALLAFLYYKIKN